MRYKGRLDRLKLALYAGLSQRAERIQQRDARLYAHHVIARRGDIDFRFRGHIPDRETFPLQLLYIVQSILD